MAASRHVELLVESDSDSDSGDVAPRHRQTAEPTQKCEQPAREEQKNSAQTASTVQRPQAAPTEVVKTGSNVQRPQAAPMEAAQPASTVQRPQAAPTEVAPHDGQKNSAQTASTVQRPQAAPTEVAKTGSSVQRPQAAPMEAAQPASTVQRPQAAPTEVASHDGQKNSAQTASTVQRPQAAPTEVAKTGSSVQRPQAAPMEAAQPASTVQRPQAAPTEVASHDGQKNSAQTVSTVQRPQAAPMDAAPHDEEHQAPKSDATPQPTNTKEGGPHTVSSSEARTDNNDVTFHTALDDESAQFVFEPSDGSPPTALLRAENSVPRSSASHPAPTTPSVHFDVSAVSQCTQVCDNELPATGGAAAICVVSTADCDGVESSVGEEEADYFSNSSQDGTVAPYAATPKEDLDVLQRSKASNTPSKWPTPFHASKGCSPLLSPVLSTPSAAVAVSAFTELKPDRDPGGGDAPVDSHKLRSLRDNSRSMEMYAHGKASVESRRSSNDMLERLRNELLTQLDDLTFKPQINECPTTEIVNRVPFHLRLSKVDTVGKAKEREAIERRLAQGCTFHPQITPSGRHSPTRAFHRAKPRQRTKEKAEPVKKSNLFTKPVTTTSESFQDTVFGRLTAATSKPKGWGCFGRPCSPNKSCPGKS